MLLVPIVFCAAGAIFLIALGAYAEVQELHSHPDHTTAVARKGKSGSK